MLQCLLLHSSDAHLLIQVLLLVCLKIILLQRLLQCMSGRRVEWSTGKTLWLQLIAVNYLHLIQI